jgi:flagellar motor switch protein FliN
MTVPDLTEAELEAQMLAAMAEDEPMFPEVTAPVAVAASATAARGDLGVLLDLQLPCYFELGSTRLSVSELLGLTRGSVVMLDRLIGEPGRFVVAGKEFAQGEVVSLEGGYYGIRITHLLAAGREQDVA